MSHQLPKCPHCGKEMSEIGERFCWHCDNEAKEIYDDGQNPKCFIATAAFGTPFAEEIDVLRSFRDNRLRKSFLGRFFISFYYAVSPPIAWIVSKSSLLKKITRAAIRPLARILR